LFVQVFRKEDQMANTPKPRSSRYRFPLYSFDEVASMSSREWDEACQRCGADMKPHRDEPEHPNKQKNT
jgi:hypothetical protein